MYIDRLLYPVTSLGPGNRAAIWVAGCNRYCKKCANPELWEQHEYQRIEPERLAGAISNVINTGIDGITITGGEPFNQAEELCKLIDSLPDDIDILVFTGYKYEELLVKDGVREFLSRIDVLIDGEYIDELNDNHAALRGSTNQRIIYLNKELRSKYEKYLTEGRKIQNFVYDYRTVSVGIHNRGFDPERGDNNAGKR